MATSHLVQIVLVGWLSFASSKKLPDFIPVCARSNPAFDKCVINAINTVRPHLAKGIPKIRVPAAEPLVIPQLEINRDLDNLKIKANLKNIRVFGGTTFVINKLKTNLNKMTLDVSLTFPLLRVTADYDVDGRLLLIPLKGKGVFRGNFTNSKADVSGNAVIVTGKKGVKFLELKGLKTKIAVGEQTVRFQNKDKNQAAITQTAANFINQNQQQVMNIISPIVEDTTIAFIEQIGNNILRSIPYSELLPA